MRPRGTAAAADLPTPSTSRADFGPLVQQRLFFVLDCNGSGALEWKGVVARRCVRVAYSTWRRAEFTSAMYVFVRGSHDDKQLRTCMLTPGCMSFTHAARVQSCSTCTILTVRTASLVSCRLFLSFWLCSLGHRLIVVLSAPCDATHERCLMRFSEWTD